MNVVNHSWPMVMVHTMTMIPAQDAATVMHTMSMIHTHAHTAAVVSMVPVTTTVTRSNAYSVDTTSHNFNINYQIQRPLNL